MTRIEATCPACGPVECSPEAFELGICNHSTATYYAFECPSCETRIQKHADERVVELLISEGVTPVHWDLPAEMLEPHDGPPLTMDDVLDFHLLLAQPGWFGALTKATR